MYNKTEKYQVQDVPGVGFEARGYWQDSVHDISTHIILDVFSFSITEARVEAARVPSDLCRQGLNSIENLKQKAIGPGFGKLVKEQVMGKKGCQVVGEMVLNSIKAIVQAGSRKRPDWMDEEIYTIRWQEWLGKYQDVCIYFAQADITKNKIQNCLSEKTGK